MTTTDNTGTAGGVDDYPKGVVGYEWQRVGVYEVVTIACGRVIAKVLSGPITDKSSYTPVPAKAWIGKRFIGEFVTPKAAKNEAERWLRMGHSA